ncbi:hypothetical protein BsWGS_08290 [Bradybaena similaris]
MMNSCERLYVTLFVILLAPTSTFSYSFYTFINASVLGTPESNDAEIYTAIADILVKEEMAEKMISPTTPNYCKLIFTALNFDVSSGDAMYASLEQGK